MPSRRHGTLAALIAALVVTLLPAAADAAPPTCAPAVARAEGAIVASATLAVPDCRDEHGEVVVPAVVAQPARGVLTGAGARYTYTTSAPTGTHDAVGFAATDPVTREVSQTLWLQVGVRTLPRPSCAALAPLVVRPGRAGRSTLSCVDGNPLATGFGVVVEHRPDALGSVDADALATGLIRFTAGPADGTDRLALRVANAAGRSELVTQELVVDAGYNTAPVCVSGSRGVRPGDTVEVALRCTDADEDPLTVTVEPPSSGAVGAVVAATGSRPASVRYTAPDATANATLRFTASDGDVRSSPAAYTITVDPALSNNPPVCDPVDRSTLRDRSVTVAVRCVDPEGGPVRLGAVPASASLGTVSGPAAADWDGAEFGFHPTAGRTGTGGFSVVARDDRDAPTTVPVRVTVEAPDAPLCSPAPAGLAVRPGGTVTGSLACANAATLAAGSVRGGTVAVSASGAWTFNAGAREQAGGFTVTPRNAEGTAGAPVTVEIDVSAGTNTPPACTGAGPSPGPRAGATAILDVVCADRENDPITASAADVSHGEATVTPAGDGFRVAFRAGTPGVGGLTLRATDSRGAGADLRIAIDVRDADANAEPACDPAAPATAYAGLALEIDVLAGCRDADGDPLTVTAPADPPGALEPVTGGRYRFTPPADATDGAVTLAFEVADGRTAVARPHRLTIVSGPDTRLTGGLPPAETNAATATLAFTSPNVADPAFECRLGTAPWQACTSPWTLEDLADGEQEAQVRTVDGARADATPAVARWTVDRVAPPAPVVTGAPSGRLGGAPVRVEWTLAEGSATCTLDGAAAVACTSPLTLADLPEGDHTLVVAARDAAGNASAAETVAWTVDGTGPARPAVLGAPGALTNLARVPLDVRGDGVDHWECRIDGAGWAACPVPLVIEGLADGAHAVAVRGVDDVGNAGAAETVGWTQDTEGPLAPELSDLPAALTASRSASPRFASASTDVAGYRCRLDAAAEVACTSGQTLRNLGDGSHTLVVTAVDRAGNRTAAPVVWEVDGTPPAAPAFSARPAALTDASGPAELAWASADAARYECRLDGRAWEGCATTASLAGLADGVHELSVRAFDAVGNRGALATATWRRAAAAVTGRGRVLSGAGVTVTSPADGLLGILGGRPAAAPAGWTAAGDGVLVDAPAASAAAPLRLDVTVPAADAGVAFAPTEEVAAALVGPCTGGAGTAAPDPCVAARGATTATVLSSVPGTVTVLRAVAPTPTPSPTAEPPTPDSAAGPGTVTPGGAAGPGSSTPAGTAAPAPTTAGPARDTTPPVPRAAVAKTRLAAALKRGLVVDFTCSERCAGQVLARVDGRTAKRYRLARRATPTVVAGGAGAGTVRLRFTPAAVKRLERVRSMRLTLVVAVADAAGNAGTTTLSARLRR